MSAICRNLVANNFTLESSSSSSNKCILLFPSVFCLQRNFPCNQGSPVYSSFTVNCGGPQITSSNNIVYEMHNETLSPAKYYVISTASASSLRYYGLGLENGNYTLTLQFAEIADLDTTGRRSLGNGEGIHVEKDFDITRVADRIPRKAVQRIYTAQVSENYMEIHFLGRKGKGLAYFEPTVRPPGG
ncbi:hypothetical protein Patl1_24251 [Pistacia atlantica]|uniref:Uncharacterized protein n=1 Tax=Pistacia atlantica TaxID=434234 RepID=A0ACC0ZXH7_9ROSI|nr:hypothetical protein Patl1_24251 [Pistacia atlantica]